MRSLMIALLLIGGLSAQSLEVGAAAPTFELKDQDGNGVTVPVKGQWTVFAFYPMAGTPG